MRKLGSFVNGNDFLDGVTQFLRLSASRIMINLLLGPKGPSKPKKLVGVPEICLI
jgi:hypothetical protein